VGSSSGGAAPSGDQQAPPASPGEERLPVELLDRVRAREPEALAAFFERYFDPIFGLVYRLLGDRTEAEDLTQEIFLKVHRAAHQLDAARDPGPWLTSIAYNACRDLWRSGAYRMGRRSSSIDVDLSLASALTRGTNDPEHDLLASERRQRVQEAIARLPEPLRVAVVLHEYQGMRHQEIAELTGVHHAAARKRYSRALAALGKMLQESQA
jgi:RNA polymerase sigma-70 factor (ECF subfamily)